MQRPGAAGLVAEGAGRRVRRLKDFGPRTPAAGERQALLDAASKLQRAGPVLRGDRPTQEHARGLHRVGRLRAPTALGVEDGCEVPQGAPTPSFGLGLAGQHGRKIPGQPVAAGWPLLLDQTAALQPLKDLTSIAHVRQRRHVSSFDGRIRHGCQQRQQAGLRRGTRPYRAHGQLAGRRDPRLLPWTRA
ncbi:MAG: hypothetical protein GEU81_14235 [Nitriliruptorales bacterium]|nr:hypothetical protein [Nitriliruptorales bacterium]